MNEVPFLGEIGYVAPVKSFNLGKVLMWIVGLALAAWCLYRLFISKEEAPRNDPADQKMVDSNAGQVKIQKAAGKL